MARTMTEHYQMLSAILYRDAMQYRMDGEVYLAALMQRSAAHYSRMARLSLLGA